MPIETFDNIDDLDQLNPLVDDPVSEGDDHLRGIKKALQANVQGDETFTALLVGGFINALVDTLALTVKGGPTTIDLDNSTVDSGTRIRLRNLIGGHMLNTVAGSGDLFFSQTNAAGAFEKNLLVAERDASVFLVHLELNENALQTVDRRIDNSSLHIFDSAGIAKPVGFNVLPRVDVAASRLIVASDSGAKVRCPGLRVLTFDINLPDDFTCVVISESDLVTLQGVGTTMRLYPGSGGFTEGTITMAAGSVATVTKAGAAATYEVWGNGVTQ